MNTVTNPISTKFKTIFLLSIILITSGCSSLLFTKEQFEGTYSDRQIPQKWHGRWTDGEDNSVDYITQDSFSIGGLNYKIIESKMNFGVDTASGSDKLIFQNDLCFLSRYVELNSTTSELSGFQILVANIDIEGNINCWEISYDYFLKNGLVNNIPTYQLINKNIDSAGIYKKIEPQIVYVSIPDKISKSAYSRLIKKVAISVTEGVPYFCDKSYNIDFFKNIAKSREPDIILTKNKNIIKRKKNKNELKFEKISENNLKKKYVKFLISK